jgi:UDPglucose 6-dehydrogenase
VVDLAVELCDFDLGGHRLAVLGAAFKPGSDDVRDSPALDVAQRLQAQGGDVRVYDPEASMNARAVAPSLTYVASVDAALAGADLVLHLTEWPQFRELDPRHAAGLVSRRCIIDGRNALAAQRWTDAGWTFHGVGRTQTLGAPRPAPARPSGRARTEPGLLDIS